MFRLYRTKRPEILPSDGAAGEWIRGEAVRSFSHLHVHSNYSLLSGANTIEEIVLAAAEMGMDSIALTDTNAL
ncbi:MAG: PHP domain-containing protein, partial [Candidatus Hydrogenedentota bacterium]